MNLQSYFGHLFCEQLSREISFSHYIALLTTSKSSSSFVTSWYVQQCILLVMVIALKMILASPYHLLKNVIFVETSQLKCDRLIVQNKRL